MIDLMPASIRQRAQAGARTRRFAVACAVVALCAGGAASWASLRLDSIEVQLSQAQTLASRALELEQQATQCNVTASAIELAVAEYHEVSFPVSVSSLVAALAETLPDGVTLESLTLSLDERQSQSSDTARTRVLRGGLSGFAASDEDVALLSRRLTGRAPFTSVRLEYSRSRVVHDHQARGFAVSFEIDLQKTYVVVGPESRAESAVASVDHSTQETRQ
jgi:hypothetical protein